MIGTKKSLWFDWNPENVLELINWWNDGFTSTEIAYRFGGGLTRNAVMGKVNRLGLRRRKNSDTPRSAAKRKSRKKEVVVILPPAPIVLSSDPPEGDLVPFMKMNYRTCRSVEGHETVNGHHLAMYCPNPKDPIESFCPYHKKIYYRKDYR